ncbi:acyltransferase [bacterium]|nr:acyltransferase [bacterium]
MKLQVAEHNHLPFIDGLRGIAILSVLAAHTSESMFMPGKFRSPVLAYFLVSGGSGVHLFFLISAFTLYSSSKHRFQRDARPVSTFYLRRAFRILPFWWLMVAAFGGLSWVNDFPWHQEHVPGGGITSANVLAHATFLFGFRPDWINSLVPGGWSLFCEETFYLFLPLVFSRIRSLTQAVQLLVITLAVHAVWNVARAGREDGFYTEIFPLSVWYNFALGILVYFFLEQAKPGEWPLDVTRVFDLSVLLLVPYLVDVQVAHGQLPISAGCAALFVAAANPRSVFHAICRFPPLRSCGVACYSIYLFHQLVLYYTYPVQVRLMEAIGLSQASKELRFAVWFPLVSLLCWGLGVLSFVSIERPCIEAGRRFIRWRTGERAERAIVQAPTA